MDQQTNENPYAGRLDIEVKLACGDEIVWHEGDTLFVGVYAWCDEHGDTTVAEISGQRGRRPGYLFNRNQADARGDCAMKTLDEQVARERVSNTPELEMFADIIFYDWRDDDHFHWVATAPVAEIVDWASTIASYEKEGEG